MKELGPIDIVVNNAGVSSHILSKSNPSRSSKARLYQLLDTCVHQACDQPHDRTKVGAIINMVSGSTLVDPIPRTFLAYSSLKVGLRAFLKGLFWEMRDHGIKVTSILPGVVDSDLTDHLKDITKEQKDRLMSPQAVADMIMFALSVPANACPLELAVINQQTPWTKPVIDYAQKQASNY